MAERINEKDLASLKNALGSSYSIAGQLQQRPSPEAGGIIKKVWFQWWKNSTPPEIKFILQSWDTAFHRQKFCLFSLHNVGCFL